MNNKRNLAFIFEDKGLEDFIHKIDLENGITFVAGSDEIKEKVQNLGYSCTVISDYSDGKNYNQKVLEWIKSWPDAIIDDNKSLKELLVYNKISIYWYLESRFFLYRIRELLILIERIKQILSKEKPEKIWIKGNQDVKQIISELLPNVIQKFELQNKTKRDITQKSYQGFPTLKLFLLKLLRGVGSTKQKINSNSNKILIITETSNWRKDYDFSLEKYVKKDIFFHEIIKKLKELSNEVVAVDFENKPSRLLKSKSLNEERRKTLGVRVEPWEKYITLEIIKKSKEQSRKFLEKWNSLKNSDDFKKSLIYEGISLYQLINDDIEHLLKSFKAYTTITFIETAERILEIEKPTVIVMHDEYGALQLSLIHAAKKRGIPTISLQHGLISDNILPYFHKPEHIKNENQGLIFPLPDKMCVWSENAKENLLKFGNFPSSIPIITGDPKVDFLKKARESFDSNKIKQKYKIKKGRKIVLFATENLPKKEENQKLAKTVISAMKKMENCHLIIKPHPNETDLTLYTNLISKYNLSESSIITEENLYELLYISNLVILSYSTVGVEAMRMGIPVISLNLMGLHDDALIIRKNMAVIVRNSDELLPTIEKHLDPKNTQKLVEEGKIFAEKELGVFDGKANDRIIEQILQLKNQKLMS